MSEKTPWTPGPWTAEHTSIGAHVYASKWGHVCACDIEHGKWHTPEESRGWQNARLIAAAPQMAELLETCVRVLSEAREMLSVFEDHGGHDGLGGKGYLATIDHMDDAKSSIRALLSRIGAANER